MEDKTNQSLENTTKKVRWKQSDPETINKELTELVTAQRTSSDRSRSERNKTIKDAAFFWIEINEVSLSHDNSYKCYIGRASRALHHRIKNELINELIKLMDEIKLGRKTELHEKMLKKNEGKNMVSTKSWKLRQAQWQQKEIRKPSYDST